MNKKLISVIAVNAVLLASVAGVISCKKSKSDDNTMVLAALALVAEQSKKNGPLATAVARGVASSIQSAAQNGNVARLMNHPNIKMQMVALAKKNKNFKPNLVIPTAMTTPTGACATTGCTATLDGTTDCMIDSNKSGTLSTTNLAITSSFPDLLNMGTYPYTIKNTLKGDVKLDKCGSKSMDYANFPNMVTVIASGDLNLDHTETVTMNSQTNTLTTMDQNLTFKMTSVLKSPNLAVGTASPQAVNATTTVDLTVVSKASNIVASFTTTSFSFKADFADTLTGPVTSSGDGYSTTKTWAGETVNYSVSCSMDMTTGAGGCTSTKK